MRIDLLWMVVPLGLIGLGLFYFLRDLRVCYFFTPTEGTVIFSEVGGTNFDRESPTYYPHIEFEYVVDAITYKTGRYRRTQYETTGRSEKEEICKKYAVGTKHPVYFDPSHPERAVIERKISFVPLAIILAGLIFFAFLYDHGKTVKKIFPGWHWHFGHSSSAPMKK